MAGLFDRMKRIAGQVLSDAASSALDETTSRSSTRRGRRRRSPNSTSSGLPRQLQKMGRSVLSGLGVSGASTSAKTRRRRGHGSTGASAALGSEIAEWNVATYGLPNFTYAPRPDGDADPGEVVWTWVPYEEDATKGKDRPVLVLAREKGGLVVAQLTSKDHDRDAAQEAHWGRYWFDIGTGDWDSRRRPSEMRVDRLLWVPMDRIRREGARLGKTMFDAATEELRRFHG